MTRLLWPLTVLLICLPVAILASGVPLPLFNRSSGGPRPRPVSSGDQELAWFHTSTNGTTWERFVSGVARAQPLVPGLRVDDSSAFLDQTTAAPEVVLSRDGRPGKLRIRWYKLTGEATAAQWVRALAQRDPPPLAVIGGGSSDRALDLARALDQQVQWRGDRPLLLITTATADEVTTELEDPETSTQLQPTTNLLDIYDGRSYRFCFTNRQMADAVLDFVWDTPGLRPEVFASSAPMAACSGLAACPGGKWMGVERPRVFSVYWQDDPFSTDLHDQFKLSLDRRLGPASRAEGWLATWSVPFSVGGFVRPNQAEARVADNLLEEFRKLPPQRSLLILPTVTHPARRLLRHLAESAPHLGQRLVAVTGDGIPVNAIYRDADIAWPVNTLPVPLVLFTHNNPVGWDTEETPANVLPGYELRPPNSTDDVLHFAELIRVVAEAAYPAPEEQPSVPTAEGLVTRADDLAIRLRAARLLNHDKPFFDAAGNRLGRTGEYVMTLWPRFEKGNAGPQTLPRATLEIWRRGGDRGWEHVRTIEIDQRRGRTAAVPLHLTGQGGRRG